MESSIKIKINSHLITLLNFTISKLKTDKPFLSHFICSIIMMENGFRAVFSKTGFYGNRWLPLTYNGENVRGLSHLFLTDHLCHSCVGNGL